MHFALCIDVALLPTALLAHPDTNAQAHPDGHYIESGHGESVCNAVSTVVSWGESMRVEVYVEKGDRRDQIDSLLDEIDDRNEVSLITVAKDADRFRYLRAFGFEETGKDIVCFHRVAR